MKVDIKSFLIGVLTTVNLFLLMGFNDNKNESQVGRYQMVMYDAGNLWVDTKNGEVIGHLNKREVAKNFGKTIKYEELQKIISERE